MCKEKNNTNNKNLKFNTYYIFSEQEQDIEKTIGLIFKDYIESLKINEN